MPMFASDFIMWWHRLHVVPVYDSTEIDCGAWEDIHLESAFEHNVCVLTASGFLSDGKQQHNIFCITVCACVCMCVYAVVQYYVHHAMHWI